MSCVNRSACFQVIGNFSPILQMADQNVTEEELKRQRKQELRLCTDPLRKLQLALLLRGSTGIKEFSRSFRIMDDDGNKQLTRDEFNKGMHDCQVPLSLEECASLFTQVDTNKSGSVNFDEFLFMLRPPMSETRRKLIDLAFGKMDKSKDGFITAADMKGVFNARKHPKFLSGEKTEEQIFNMYLAHFEIGGHQDGKVTKEEFFNYYNAISASIDNDCYFDLMMRNAWKI
ncbi:unnamed protein product, partial [Mesorhabditis belari]|uniref:EF-hand domain-containing protein n=1 Tax=Mesorhabditis belari TaxID=2138241 RepID=A0AAF3EZL2_9BILA